MRSTSRIAIQALLLLAATGCDADKPAPQAGPSQATSEAAIDGASIDRASAADALAAKVKDADAQKAVRDFVLTASNDDLAALLAGKKDVDFNRTTGKEIHCTPTHCHVHLICHPGRFTDVNDCSIDTNCDDFDPGSCH
jgi:hypothetical protein